jgi:hypothetical protein
MNRPRRRHRPALLPTLLLAAALAGSSGGTGCMCYLHPLPQLAPEFTEPCHGVPKAARDHVYVFLVHGLDPLDFANLSGVADFVRDLGFCKTYYGQLYHPPWFDSEIRKVCQDDPEARIVLVGFSFGANMVRSLAQSVKTDHVKIASLIYFGGNTLHNNDRDQPDNAEHIANILAYGCIWNGAQMDRAENLRAPGVWHFGSPTHPVSLKVLARELARVAATVPVIEEPPDVPPPEEAPTPRPLKPQADELPPPRRLPPPEELPPPRPVPPPKETAHHGEWDFLKPVSSLQPTIPPPLPEGTYPPTYQTH